MKVLTDYDYVYNIIDYNHMASENGDYEYYYDFLRLCNQLWIPITITPSLQYIGLKCIEVWPE